MKPVSTVVRNTKWKLALTKSDIITLLKDKGILPVDAVDSDIYFAASSGQECRVMAGRDLRINIAWTDEEEVESTDPKFRLIRSRLGDYNLFHLDKRIYTWGPLWRDDGREVAWMLAVRESLDTPDKLRSMCEERELL